MMIFWNKKEKEVSVKTTDTDIGVEDVLNGINEKGIDDWLDENIVHIRKMTIWAGLTLMLLILHTLLKRSKK